MNPESSQTPEQAPAPSPAKDKKTKEDYFTLRFPIEWEERIVRLRKALEGSRTAAILQVRDSTVVRKAAIIGMRKLLEKYEARPEVERE